MAKKIVICSNTAWNIYNFHLSLASVLKSNSYKVILIAPFDEYSKFLKNDFEYHDIYINSKGVNPIEDISTLFSFYKLYRKIRPDLVLNYTIKPNIYGNIVCRLLGITVINNITGLGTVFIRQSFISSLAKWLYKVSLKSSALVIFQNQDDRDLFVNNNIVNKSQTNLIPGSGIDTKLFKPVILKKNKKTSNNINKKFRFLLNARILWDKGIGEYVEAAKILQTKYPEIIFELLGPTNVANITAISKEQVQLWQNQGIINYIGVTCDVKKYIAKADCVVLPSYREGVPRALLEAASMKKPIVTTNVPGCKEVVKDGVNGYLCEVKNAKDLANKMQQVFCLSNKDRENMGKAGRHKVVSEFDIKIVVDKYLNIIESLLKQRTKQ